MFGGLRHDRALVIRAQFGEGREGVAAVVSRTGERDDARTRRRHLAQVLGDADARIVHERILAGNRDRRRVDGAHLLGRQDVDHCSSTTTAAAVLAVCVIVR